MELRISYYEEQPAAEYTMPDVLEINCKDELGKDKTVFVYVERPVANKPYLGGFRHKETTVEFHHAFTQTPRPPVQAKATKYHREVQTYAGLQIRGSKFQSSNSNSRELELTNLLGLVLGCIEAKFCK